MQFIDQSIELLKDNGYKITGPRVAVLNALATAHIPLSPYDIEERIPENIPVNVVTIYRVLDVFEQLGIVHRILTKHGYVRCDFEEKPGCHHFAICDRCEQVSEFVQKKECDTEMRIPSQCHFQSAGHFAEVTGLCEACSR
ncbi:transcriptional repressor [Candidatus Peregrinibacteria bacterium]|nr:MAG: transcriptional repressor [Candidatus Peregrinibacteria bacterium]